MKRHQLLLSHQKSRTRRLYPVTHHWGHRHSSTGSLRFPQVAVGRIVMQSSYHEQVLPFLYTGYMHSVERWHCRFPESPLVVEEVKNVDFRRAAERMEFLRTG